jgi:hypothetical protein
MLHQRNRILDRQDDARVTVSEHLDQQSCCGNGQESPQGASVKTLQARAPNSAEDNEKDRAKLGANLDPQGRNVNGLQKAAPAWLATGTVVAWCVCSGGRMFANKTIYRSFPFPLAVTGASQVVAFLSGVALTRAGIFRYRACKSWSMWLMAALPASIVSCATLYTGNLAVMMLPVTYVQIVKGLTPSITLLLAAAMGTERLSMPLVTTVLVISIGSGISCLQAYSMAGFDVLGMFVQVMDFLNHVSKALVAWILPVTKLFAVQKLPAMY